MTYEVKIKTELVEMLMTGDFRRLEATVGNLRAWEAKHVRKLSDELKETGKLKKIEAEWIEIFYLAAARNFSRKLTGCTRIDLGMTLEDDVLIDGATGVITLIPRGTGLRRKPYPKRNPDDCTMARKIRK